MVEETPNSMRNPDKECFNTVAHNVSIEWCHGHDQDRSNTMNRVMRCRLHGELATVGALVTKVHLRGRGEERMP